MNVKISRILLVEDSDRDAELVVDALGQQLVNEVIRVRDGAEALDYLHHRGSFADNSDGLPIVVLLDLKMPKMDGMEVLAHIRNDPQLKLLPVVMITSSREDQDLVNSYTLGVNAYVVKPVNFTAFVDAVKFVGAFWAVVNEPPPAKRR